MSRGGEVVADGRHDVGPVEQPTHLFRRAPVRDVGVVEDVGERPAAMVLADHVLGHDLLLPRAREEEGERGLDDVEGAGHAAILHTPFAEPVWLPVGLGRALLARLGCRPFQVGIRDRIAVRVVRREAEGAVDPLLQLLGDHVLEPVGFVVDRVDMEAECLGEVQLEQAVVRITSSATRSPASVRRAPR